MLRSTPLTIPLCLAAIFLVASSPASGAGPTPESDYPGFAMAANSGFLNVKTDDTAAIQKAFDSGKPVVYGALLNGKPHNGIPWPPKPGNSR